MAEKASGDLIYKFLRNRLGTSIQTAKAVIEGDIEQPDKILSYLLFPPVLPMRGDLSQGSLKLIYGDSCDMTFVIVNDISEEVFFLFNGHCEDGIPVDWWLINPEDEILERRHLKYGYKLKEMPKQTKGFFKAGERLMDVLKDIRNERSPQWADSSYIVCMVWVSAILNLMSEASNFEQYGGIWDGIYAKKLGLPDTYFGYIPWPSILKTFMMAGRKKWILSLTGLTSANRIYMMPLEAEGFEWLIEELPEYWERGVILGRQQGVPYPWQSLEVKLPNFKKKSTYENEEFDFQYPPGDWITPENLGMTAEDTLRGIYLDIDHETRVKADRSHIISVGIGQDTEFFK
ncbi:MAG: hypothetical protein HWN66_09785 [Candidatus Helarchaeota archaeon]|nr:hypothetical protein [Candidatus Helarchaeota archaeon]